MSPQPWPYSHVTLAFRKENALFPYKQQRTLLFLGGMKALSQQILPKRPFHPL